MTKFYTLVFENLENLVAVSTEFTKLSAFRHGNLPIET